MKKGSTERLSHLLKVTQLVPMGARIRSRNLEPTLFSNHSSQRKEPHLLSTNATGPAKHIPKLIPQMRRGLTG